MSVKSRNRTISFRLTAEEYDRFRQLCFAQGVASVSEMARTAINALFEQSGHASDPALAARVAELEIRLKVLGLEVKRIISSVSSTSVAPSV